MVRSKSGSPVEAGSLAALFAGFIKTSQVDVWDF